MDDAPEANTVALPLLPDGWFPTTYAALCDGTLAILGADCDLRSEWRRDESGKVLGSPVKAAASAGAKLWVFDGNNLVEGPSFPLLTPFPMVDRFTDGRWLIASSGAVEERNGNARILSSLGAELDRIHIGYGIEHLKVDSADHIWVGWFDEGTSGNKEWRIAGREWPPSSDGLAAFDQRGMVVAHAIPVSSESMIADCYALNVIGETAFACTYMGFPIVSLSIERQVWFSTELRGPRALAVKLPYVLAVGGYADKGNEAVLLRLEAEKGQALGRWRLPISLGYPNHVDLIDGRETTIHAVKDHVWFRWEIESFLENGQSN